MIKKPKFKIGRRLGAGVYDKCQTSKFSSASGKFSDSRTSRRPRSATEYGTQLIEKQKVQYSYGITERQLSNYVKKAVGAKGGRSADALFAALESRLDSVVYRMGIVRSRRAGRQVVSHGHILVCGRRVTIPSYSLKPGDVVKIRDGSRGKKIFSRLLETSPDSKPPSWLVFDAEKMEGKILERPVRTDTFLDFPAVLEFYSR